ncbi:MAG: translation initiation factor eIF-1A [Candidatus Anstonellales archaeon]
MEEQESIGRVRLAKEDEIYGVIVSNVGSSHLIVQCKDGRERMCRIPGKIKRDIWVKEGDVVLVKPWQLESDKKCDLVWRYNRLQAEWLRKKGII